MDSGRWLSSPLGGGQSENRKRTFQQMQRSHNNTNVPGDFSSLPPAQQRPSSVNNRFFTTTNNNHHHQQHNPLLFQDIDDIMAERVIRTNQAGSRSRVAPYPAPSLQHQTSQTVIDLTGDSDDARPRQPQRSARGGLSRISPPSPPSRSHSRVGLLSLPRPERQRPPRFGRHNILDSEGEEEDIEAEDLPDLVDLTQDNNNNAGAATGVVAALRLHIYPRSRDPDPAHSLNRMRSQFDMRRPAGMPAPSPNHPPPHDLQVPRAHRAPRGPRAPHAPHLPPYLPHGPNPDQPRGGFANISDHFQRMIGGSPLMGYFGAVVGNQADFDNMAAMNYDAVAFAHHRGDLNRPAPAPRTPYLPPQPAREGYTRSLANLKEDEILVCAACDEELVVKPKEDAPAKTTAKGKPLTEKERAEHDFWAVRKCGHVFCDDCYQNRKDKSDGGSYFYAAGRPKTEKSLICTVDECYSNVSKPTDWIGMFI